MNEGYIVGNGELAGFDLCGWRQVNNTIKIKGSIGVRYIADWPKEVTLCGATYTLETVQPGSVNEETGERWENAIYV